MITNAKQIANGKTVSSNANTSVQNYGISLKQFYSKLFDKFCYDGEFTGKKCSWSQKNVQ